MTTCDYLYISPELSGENELQSSAETILSILFPDHTLVDRENLQEGGELYLETDLSLISCYITTEWELEWPPKLSQNNYQLTVIIEYRKTIQKGPNEFRRGVTDGRLDFVERLSSYMKKSTSSLLLYSRGETLVLEKEEQNVRLFMGGFWTDALLKLIDLPYIVDQKDE